MSQEEITWAYLFIPRVLFIQISYLSGLPVEFRSLQKHATDFKFYNSTEGNK